VVSATLELVGGIALLVGLFTRWFGLLYICEFTITFFYVKLRLTGFVDGRIDLMMLAGAMLLAQLPQLRDHRSDFLGLLDRISSSCCVRVSEMRV
jgi:hypothetical protein